MKAFENEMAFNENFQIINFLSMLLGVFPELFFLGGLIWFELTARFRCFNGICLHHLLEKELLLKGIITLI